jgi:hypothetical protein
VPELPEVVWPLLAVFAVVLFGRFVLRMLRRFLPLMALALLAVIVLSQWD